MSDLISNMDFFRAWAGKKAWVRHVLSFGLALFYLASLCFHDVHLGEEHHFHGETAEHCHEQSTVDPCHQAIYHAGLSHCPHDAHLYASVISCDACDLLLSKIWNHRISPESPEVALVRADLVQGDAPCPTLGARESIWLRGPPRG